MVCRLLRLLFSASNNKSCLFHLVWRKNMCNWSSCTKIWRKRREALRRWKHARQVELPQSRAFPLTTRNMILPTNRGWKNRGCRWRNQSKVHKIWTLSGEIRSSVICRERSTVLSAGRPLLRKRLRGQFHHKHSLGGKMPSRTTFWCRGFCMLLNNQLEVKTPSGQPSQTQINRNSALTLSNI